MVLFASSLAAAAVLLLAAGLYRYGTVKPSILRARRTAQMLRRRAPRGWAAIAQRLGAARADQLCQYAGRPYGLTGISLLQAQFLCGLLFLVAFAGASLWFALFAGVLAAYLPRLLVSAMAQQRRAQIALELPAFLDLWGLLVAAGEGVETALVEICRRHPDWLLTAEIQRVRDRVSASGLFGESLVEEARVTGSPEFITVAEQVHHLVAGGGVPSRELGKMAEQMRQQRVTELMQSAGAMSIVGIFPKMFSVFLSLAPVFAAIILTVAKQVGR